MRTRALPTVLLIGTSIAFTGTRAAGDSAVPSGPAAVPAAAPIQPESLRVEFARKMRPEARPKVLAVARILVFDLAAHQHKERAAPRGGAKMPAFDLVAAARSRIAEAQYFGLANPQASDIEALVQIVMLEAAHDAEDDLKAALAAVRAVDKAKAGQREWREALKSDADLRKEDLQRIVSAMNDKKSALDDLRQEMAVNLQMAMDRKTKMLEMLSTILKKETDTAQNIVRNMK
jgi:hypothetical protein